MMRFLRTRAAAARGGSGDAGVTLAEMSVTILVLGMLVAALVSMVTSGMRITSGVKERLDQSNSATIAMQRVTRDLRTAVLQSQLTTACIIAACTDSAFLTAGPYSVSFYADVDNPNNSVGPSRVSYTVVGGVLTETVQPPDTPIPTANGYVYCTPGTNGCNVRTEVLATGVQMTSPVFSYYAASAPTTAMVMGTGNVLTAPQLKTVDSIDVVIQVVQAGGTPVGGTTLMQRVALPNADSVVLTNGS